HHHRELAGQGGRSGWTGTLEAEVSQSRIASRARRRAHRLDARALVDVDAHSREPAACTGEDQAEAGGARSGRRSHARVARMARKAETVEGEGLIAPPSLSSSVSGGKSPRAPLA